MKFQITFIQNNGWYLINLPDTEGSIGELDFVRACGYDIEAKEFLGTTNMCVDHINAEVTEETARLSGHFQAKSTVKVKISHDLIVYYIKRKYNPEEKKIFYTVDTKSLIQDWALSGYPLEWVPKQK